MASLDIAHTDPVVQRSFPLKPPKHYQMSINSFSSLKSVDKYESGEFKAGGYKWRLVLFPNGNNNRGVNDHISLYLEMAGDKPIDPRKIVTIDYKLFLLNRQKKSYLALEDSNKDKKNKKKYCIYRTIVGGLAGFDRFIPLKEFNDASNGYLIDDECEFGAEVFVSESSTRRKGRGECLFMDISSVMYKHVWKTENVSKRGAHPIKSAPFVLDNQKYCTWQLILYPKGHNSGSHGLTVSLGFGANLTLPPGSKILVGLCLRIVNQIHGQNYSAKSDLWCIPKSTEINPSLIRMVVEHKESAWFSMDDSCIVEAEITIKGVCMPKISTRRWPWSSK